MLSVISFGYDIVRYAKGSISKSDTGVFEMWFSSFCNGLDTGAAIAIAIAVLLVFFISVYYANKRGQRKGSSNNDVFNKNGISHDNTSDYEMDDTDIEKNSNNQAIASI